MELLNSLKSPPTKSLFSKLKDKSDTIGIVIKGCNCTDYNWLQDRRSYADLLFITSFCWLMNPNKSFLQNRFVGNRKKRNENPNK